MSDSKSILDTMNESIRSSQSTRLERLVCECIRAKLPLINASDYAQAAKGVVTFCVLLEKEMDFHGMAPEPFPDELPIFNERRVIMTRAQFACALLKAIDTSRVWHRSGWDPEAMTTLIIGQLEKVIHE